MELKREDLLEYTTAKLREAPELAEDHISINGKKLRKRTAYIRLRGHLDNFLKGNRYNRFIVMPGLRRIGKTTILFQLYDYLKNEKGIEQDRILYISVDELSAYFGAKLINIIDVFITDIHQSSQVGLDKELFILVDESHYDKKWSQIGKILYDKSNKIFMIFTGSSALSLELNDDESVRTKKEPVFPMNLFEYLILKYKIFAPEGTARSLRDLIFKGDSKSIENALKMEGEIRKRTIVLKNPLEKEWKDFLRFGGFPFIHSDPNLDTSDVYDKVYRIVEAIIQKDVFLQKSFMTDSISTIFNIILFLALQDPGPASQVNLAKRLNTSSSQVNKIIDVLEKTHLIFNIKPYGSIGKSIRKPRKYYFLSPTIKAALNFKYGKYDQNNPKFLGILAENLIASCFFKMKETINMPLGIFYATESKGVDFLLRGIDEDIIPVEVGIGEDKHINQLEKAIKRYKSKYGILISNRTKKIIKNEDIIYIPLITFSFL